MSIPNYHNRKLANALLDEHGTSVVGKAITLQKLIKMGLSEYQAIRAISENTAVQRLPDARYSASLVYGGYTGSHDAIGALWLNQCIKQRCDRDLHVGFGKSDWDHGETPICGRSTMRSINVR